MTDPIFLTDAEAERKKAERDVRVNTVLFPLFRALGLGLLLGAVRLHDFFVLQDTEREPLLQLGIGYAVYALVSWAILRQLYARWRGLALVFLALDVVAWTFAIYASGADRSWLFLVLLMRPADQTPTGVPRVLGFGLLSMLCYLVLIAHVANVEHRAVSWAAELTKVSFLGLATLYMLFPVFPAMTAQQLRGRTISAIHASREMIHELEDARRRAEEASRVKSQFMANISHELRTPMNGIVGMTDLALLTPLNEDQRTYLKDVQQCSERLLRLLNDLLDFARIEASGVDPKASPMSLRAVLAGRVQEYAAEALGKGIDLGSQIAADVPDAVSGDAWAVRQVLHHVAGNAIKFTERGAVRIEVALDAREADGLRLRFAVADTGIGIPDELAGVVFESFTQADNSSTRRYQGSGLGLTIASRLVHLLGGRLWFESRVEQGTTFFFTLPFGLQEGVG